MKKKLLLLCLPILLISSTIDAQIKYWDFGAKELGAGYDNMLPESYLNAFSNYNRKITYTKSTGEVETADPDESGHSPESLYALYLTTFDPKYLPYENEIFQLTSKSSSPTPPGGTLLSGGSDYTKPDLLPDLDGTTNMVFYKDSNSDRLITVNTNLTRYDDRTGMPDDVKVGEFSGCLQFTTPGEKRYNSSGRFRGFLMDLAANEYLTVVASGEYVDIEGDGPPYINGCSTGWFSFESYGGTGTPVLIEDKGTGTGAFDCSGLSGGDTGDEAVRVMEFQAVGAQTYKLAYRGGRARFYRLYVSSTSIKSEVEKILSVDDLASPVSTDLRAIGNRIYLSNVKVNTQVNIYSITGALVKSFKTKTDTDFEFKSGLWIATIKTSEGQKSVKFVTTK